MMVLTSKNFRAIMLAVVSAISLPMPALGQTVSPWTRWLTLDGRNDRMFRVVTFSADGKYVAGGQNDGLLQFWDVDAWQRKTTLETNAAMPTLAARFSPDGKSAILADRDGVSWRRLDASAPAQRFSWQKQPAQLAALAANGKLAATTAADGKIYLWDLGAKKQLAVLQGHDRPVFALDFSAKGDWLASGDSGNTVRLWDVTARKKKAALRSTSAGIVRAVALSADGRRLVSVGDRDGIRVWDTTERKPIATLRAGVFPFHAVALSSDGKTIAAGSGNGTVEIWDAANGKLLAHFRAHLGMVFSLAFSADGRLLASGGNDTVVRIWDAGRRVVARKIPHSNQELQTLFEQAQSSDEFKSCRAVLHLAATPKQTVKFLNHKLHLGKVADPKQAALIVKKLDSDNFRIRTKAAAELKQMGQVAVKALRKVLEKPGSLEMRLRAEKILDEIDSTFAKTKRKLSLLAAIEILQRIGSNDAEKMLRQIYLTIPHEAVVDEARAALARARERKY